MAEEAQQGGSTTRSRQIPAAWWVAGMAMYLPAVSLAIVWQRWPIAIAATLGLLAPALVLVILEFAPNPHRVMAGLVSALLIVLAASLVLARKEDAGLAAKELSAPYEARAVLEGKILRLEEEVTREKNDSAWSEIFGWRLVRTVDGSPVYRRTRELPVRARSAVELEVDLQIIIGMEPGGAWLVPRSGSVITFTAPKGSLRVTSPPADELVDLPRRQEMASVPLGPGVDRVLVGVRPSWLRNPVGRSLDSVVTWGLTPWVVGLLGAGLSTVAVGRLHAGADSILDRIFGRSAPQVPPRPTESQQGHGVPAPRSPRRDHRPRRGRQRRRRR